MFTLDKSSGSFSPTTRYRDYAITRNLIHWESQSITRADSATGPVVLDGKNVRGDGHPLGLGDEVATGRIRSRDGVGLADVDPRRSSRLAPGDAADVLGLVLHDSEVVCTEVLVAVDVDIALGTGDVALDFA